MTLKHRTLLGCLYALAWSSASIAGVGVPRFGELEGDYAQSGTVSEAQHKIAEAIPAGMTVAEAQALLSDAGATCRTDRHAASLHHCLIHQYSLADGAADDVRWSIYLDAPDGRVRTIRVSRYVDRHGTS